MNPCLHFRPLRPAVASDGATTLDLLIRVHTPERPDAVRGQRPPLNLALVIDRSGSMAGSKLSHARHAACVLAGELTERDRLAIVSFDDAVTVLVPSQPVHDPLPFVSAIHTITAGGCTALFDGWLAGAKEVAAQLNTQGLNRVLLLSDGQANEGLTEPTAIVAKVEGLTQRGISTSAFGLGRGFDEDLMGAVATAGDGTLAQIESPAQLADLYASELQGLASTLGTTVRLGIHPCHGAEVLEMVCDLPRSSSGEVLLPNLRYGQQLSIGARLQLPAWLPNQEIANVCLSWECPQAAGRQQLLETLTLPVLPQRELGGLLADQEVAEQLALLQANRDRLRVIAELDRDDLQAALASLEGIDQHLAGLPQSDAVQRERRLLAEKQALLRHDRNLSRKRLRRESLRSNLNVWEGGDGRS